MPACNYTTASARALARDVATRAVSPIELVEAAIERHLAVEPEINAFQTFDAEGARAQARVAERAVMTENCPLGPLHGVPVSVKDLIDVAGLPAMYGSRMLADNVAPDDAPSVARLRAAGAIIMGKTATSEFGYKGYTESLTHGLTRNPWDLSRTPGGSSGGASASVAAGVTPLALGTDGGGSIRTPSAFTGLVGIKANFGRVPVWPASATPTVAHVGPMARNVDDAALLLSVIAGADLRDPFSLYPDMGLEPSLGKLRGLRVAWSPTLGYARPDSEVLDTVTRAVTALHAIFPAISEVDKVCEDPASILGTEFIGGCSARFGNFADAAPQDIDPPLLAAVRAIRERSGKDINAELRRRITHRETLREFFQTYDLLLTPTTATVAWPLGHQVPPGHEDAASWAYYTYPFNLSGQPAGTIPCGVTASGLPVGLQLVVPLLQEARLVAVMRAAEDLLNLNLDFPVGALAGHRRS